MSSRRDFHLVLVRLDRGVRCEHRNAEQQGVLLVWEAGQLVELGDVGALGYEGDVLLFEQLLNSLRLILLLVIVRTIFILLFDYRIWIDIVRLILQYVHVQLGVLLLRYLVLLFGLYFLSLLLLGLLRLLSLFLLVLLTALLRLFLLLSFLLASLRPLVAALSGELVLVLDVLLEVEVLHFFGTEEQHPHLPLLLILVTVFLFHLLDLVFLLL